MRIACKILLLGVVLASAFSPAQTPKAQKKFDEARRDMDYLRPGMPDYARQRILQKAEKLLLQAIEESPDWAAAHAELGMVRMRSNSISPALQSFARARELDLQNHSLTQDQRHEAMNFYGEALARDGKYDKAIELFQGLVKDDPEYGGYEYNFACVYSEQGKLSLALPHLKRAWELRRSFDFPDPRKDESFQKWLDDPRFQEVVRNMVI